MILAALCVSQPWLSAGQSTFVSRCDLGGVVPVTTRSVKFVAAQ